MKQYEIWWADLPNPVGRRPVLLLSRNSAYDVLNKYLAAEITSTVRDIPIEVSLGKPEGLSTQCVANLDKIRTISRAHLTRMIGRLADSSIPDLKRALGYALEWEELIESVSRPF